MDEIHVLLAERACERLTYEYCAAVDFGHASRLADVFARDGVFHAGGLHLEGRDEIRRVFRQREQIRDLQTRHVCSNIVVDVVDETSARGLVYLTLYRRRGMPESGPIGTTLPSLVGSYDDEYVFEDGRWLIKVRRQAVPFADPDDVSWLTQN